MRLLKKLLACTLALSMMSGLCMTSYAAEAAGKKLADLAVGEKAEHGMYTVQREENNIWHVEDYTAENPRGMQIDADGNFIGMNNCSDMYVVLGEEKAMLVDLSNPFPDNWKDLQEIFNELAGDREQLIWVTHWHGDHTGQFGAFEKTDMPIYITKEDVPSLSEAMQARVTPFDAAEDTIDLGGRTFKCVLVPGHTDGSNVLYETATKVGFSGDAVGSGNGVWMFGGLDQYETGLAALSKVVQEELGGEISLYGGHTWQQTGTGEFIDMNETYVKDMSTLVGNIKTGGEFKLENYAYGSMGLDTNVSFGTAIITVNKAKVIAWGLTGGNVINPFVDIAYEDVADAVARLYAKGIVKGTSYDTFNPEGGLTRAEFMTLLGRCAGAEVDHNADSSFSDVRKDGWSTGYITWGVENELVQGDGEGLFHQYAPVTEEQANLIIIRYNKKFGTKIPTYPEPTKDALRGNIAILLAAGFTDYFYLPPKTQVKYLDMGQFTAWGEYLDPEDYVSYRSSYAAGSNINLFEEKTFVNPDTEEKELVCWGNIELTQPVGDIKYYVYDPIAHGADPNKTYPVIYWFHGSGNAADAGKLAVAYGGAEQYATEAYQEKIGGAYIVCPLANEFYEEGSYQVRMNWGATVKGEETSAYSGVLKQLMDGFIEENKDHYNGKLVIAGTSMGGYLGWRYTLDHTEDVAATMLMAPAYVPTDEDLKKVEDAGINMWYIVAKHDELVPYDANVAPVRDKLLALDKMELTELEWVRNGDKGIATLNFGLEMGQHCICNQVANNLIYDDGTPYDENHPEGVTAWFAKVAQ